MRWYSFHIKVCSPLGNALSTECSSIHLTPSWLPLSFSAGVSACNSWRHQLSSVFGLGSTVACAPVPIRQGSLLLVLQKWLLTALTAGASPAMVFSHASRRDLLLSRRKVIQKLSESREKTDNLSSQQPHHYSKTSQSNGMAAKLSIKYLQFGRALLVAVGKTFFPWIPLLHASRSITGQFSPLLSCVPDLMLPALPSFSTVEHLVWN